MGCFLCEQKVDFSAPDCRICLHCGSRPHDRDVAWFFARLQERRPFQNGDKILEVAPAGAQARFFPQEKFIGPARYTAINVIYLPEYEALRPPHRFLEMDVTRLTFSDNSFDVILCNHVFPFIRSDFQAMSQVHRCLKGKGVAVLNAKVALPKSRRAQEAAQADPDAFSENELAEFGTEWAYGEDYFGRLEAAGFFWHRFRIDSLIRAEEQAESGLSPEGELILGFKFRDSMAEFLESL